MRCVICGSGWSIRQKFWHVPIKCLDLWDRLNGEITFATNWNYKWFTPTVLCFSDYRFYATERDNLRSLPMVMGPTDGFYMREDFKPLDNTILFEEAENVDINGQSFPKFWGKDSWKKGLYTRMLAGIWPITLAYLLGFDEVYLLGMDACGDSEGRTHFYSDTEVGRFNWKGMKLTGVNNLEQDKSHVYHKPEELNNFWYKPFEDLDMKIYNVSLESKINNFPKISYREFYKRLKEPNRIHPNKIREQIKNEL